MKKLVVLLLILSAANPLLAQTKTLLNLDKTGLAIQGYDHVAFFTDHKPVRGKAELASKHDGATYLFSSKEHKDLFDKEPAKYEPVFGGYCAYGVSRNKLVEIDVDAFQIVDGHLILQYSKSVRNDFNKDTQGNLAKAEQDWPGLVEKKGKPYSPPVAADVTGRKMNNEQQEATDREADFMRGFWCLSFGVSLELGG